MRPIPLSHMRVIREEALKVLLNPAKFVEDRAIGVCHYLRCAYKSRLPSYLRFDDHFDVKGETTVLVYGIVAAYLEYRYGEHHPTYLGGQGEWNEKRYALCLWLATAPYAEIQRVTGTKFVGAELDPYFS